MRLVLLGPPGAGKGTQALILKDMLGIVHISTGDILRDEMSKKTSLSKEISRIVEQGALVPDEIVTKIIERKLTQDKSAQQGFMLDGFPRTKKQAEDLDKILNKLDKSINYALNFDCSLPVIIQRLTGRRVCRKCGALFHTMNKPPKKEGVCDVCAGELYQRPDDNEETIKKRLRIYFENTTPIIQYYEAQNKLRRLDANEDAQALNRYLMKMFHEDGKIDKDKVERRTRVA